MEFNEAIFMQELSDLVKKHEMKGCVFSGETTEGKMFGVFSIEKHQSMRNIKDDILSFAHAARLYQSAREKILKMMDNL